MVDAGTLQVGGSINTGNIERGLKRVESGMGDVSSKSDSVNSSLTRTRQIAGRVGSVMAGLGTAAVGGMIAMAKNAPATAGAMAEMKVAGDRLTRSFGEGLAPAFDEAGKGIGNFASWVEDNEGAIKDFTTGTVEDLGDAFSTVGNTLIWLNNIDLPDWMAGKEKGKESGKAEGGLLKDIGAPSLVGGGVAGIGKLLGIKGAGSAGMIAGGATGLVSSDTLLGSTLSGATAGASAGSFIPGAGTLAGGGVGAGVGAKTYLMREHPELHRAAFGESLTTKMFDFFTDTQKNQNRKDQSLLADYIGL